jgi:hypothetical protein
LQWSGTTWLPASVTGTGTVTSVTAAAPLTGGVITSSGTIGLGTTGTAGTYGSGTMVPVITTDAYGRVTNVVPTAISAAAVTMGGDVTGTSSASTVVKLQGRPISPTAPTTGQVLEWTGAAWTPSAAGGGGSVTSTGTPNYISMFTTSTNIGNSGFYQDPSTNDVGLGTITPSATLDVESSTDNMIGNFVDNNSTAPTVAVVQGLYSGTDILDFSTGVYGASQPSTSTSIGTGVSGFGGANGVLGDAETEDPVGFPIGVSGTTESDAFQAIGVSGSASMGTSLSGSLINYGVYGTTDLSGLASDYAGEFNGYLDCSMDFTCGGLKLFRMDHPLDPANKFLNHSCVESDEVLNIYSGNITTDANGDATITLPDYFEALNKDFRYQLTVIGSFAQAMVSKKESGNKFSIKTNQPNIEVSWQISGVRHDVYAVAHPMKTEVEKKGILKGKYIHPELYGKPKNEAISYVDLSKVKHTNNASKTKTAPKNSNTNVTK